VAPPTPPRDAEAEVLGKRSPTPPPASDLPRSLTPAASPAAARTPPPAARETPRTPTPAAREAPRKAAPVVADNPLLPAPSSDHLRIAAGQFERANQVVASEDFEYGIRLLLTCCKLDPANVVYRQALRQSQRTRFERSGRAGWLTWLTTLWPRLQVRAAVRSQEHLKVLERGELVLSRDPHHLGTQMDMARAAESLGLPSVAIWVLDQSLENDAGDFRAHRALARLHEKEGDFQQAISLWETVCKALPLDSDAQQKLKDLAARDTIARGRYVERMEGRSGTSKRSGRRPRGN
jgi:hypothetical protein